MTSKATSVDIIHVHVHVSDFNSITPPPPDLRQAQLRSSECQDDGFVVPLVMQNKPPTVEGREGDELADVDLRPEQVCVCVFVGGGGCEMVCRVLVHSPKAHLD